MDILVFVIGLLSFLKGKCIIPERAICLVKTEGQTDLDYRKAFKDIIYSFHYIRLLNT